MDLAYRIFTLVTKVAMKIYIRLIRTPCLEIMRLGQGMGLDRRFHKRMMRRAIEVAKRGIEAGQSPFGCVIVRDGEIIAEAHNTVVMDNDPTAHAEINAIRKAAKKLKTYVLKGCIVYSTCEPCPMCFSAIHWANADMIVYGASIESAAALGFRELRISNEEMKRLGGSTLKILGGILKDECIKMMNEWSKRKDIKLY